MPPLDLLSGCCSHPALLPDSSFYPVIGHLPAVAGTRLQLLGLQLKM